MKLYNENCRYCTHSPELYDLCIKIADLRVSTLYLFKEQTYRGRCLLAYKEHAKEIYELTDEDYVQFSLDIRDAAKAISEYTGFDKLNTAICGDKQPHLHIHIIPKYENGAEWGQVFVMNPRKVYLAEDEYTAIVDGIKSHFGKCVEEAK